jgi:hypothetical protein
MFEYIYVRRAVMMEALMGGENVKVNTDIIKAIPGSNNVPCP